MTVRQLVAAPPEQVFDWLADASNYTKSPFVVRERLVERGDSAPYGRGAVCQLTWVFGWFREHITEYERPSQFHYLVEKSIPPLLHEDGYLRFSAVPEGTMVEWTTIVKMRIPLIGTLITRALGKPVIAYTFRNVISAAGKALAAPRSSCSS